MSHITGADKRTLARLVRKHGAANVIGETHEIAGKRNPRRRRSRHKQNPALALVGANPRGGTLLGRCTEVRYLRETGAHRGKYRHPFKTRARLLAMPNGSLAIIGG